MEDFLILLVCLEFGRDGLQEFENQLGGVKSTAPMHRQPCSSLAVVVYHLKNTILSQFTTTASFILLFVLVQFFSISFVRRH